MTTPLRAVLWDLDGTLVDSADLHWQSWRDTLAAEGHRITHRQFLETFGQKNDRILPGWLGEDTPLARIRRVGDAKEAEYRRLVEVHGVTPLPGAAAWIRRLHAAGWKQAIASSAPKANVVVMLRVLGVDSALDAIVAAEDVTRGKPDPEVFLAAAAAVGAPSQRCVVVEDAAAGVEAARRAGMKVIGVNHEMSLAADVVVASLEGLSPDAFDRLVGPQEIGALS
jgi:HAD superfamily hydrolase (TIGR01509 family)